MGQELTPFTLFKNVYSVILLIFSITLVMGLIFTEQTNLSKNMPCDWKSGNQVPSCVIVAALVAGVPACSFVSAFGSCGGEGGKGWPNDLSITQ